MKKTKTIKTKKPKFRYFHEEPITPPPKPTGQWDFDYADYGMGSSRTLSICAEESARYTSICLDETVFSLDVDAVNAFIKVLKKAKKVITGKRRAKYG